MWYLVGPDTGANDVIVTFGTAGFGNAFATSFSGVDQTIPFTANTTASGEGGPVPSVDITCGTDGMAIDQTFGEKGLTAVGGGQTLINISDVPSNSPMQAAAALLLSML